MKKLIIFSMLAILLFAGCAVGVNPQDEVGFAAGWAHCMDTWTFLDWTWRIVLTFVGIAVIVIAIRSGHWSNYIGFAVGVVLVVSWFWTPFDLGRNTTVEQAKRGVWIGY